MTVAAKRSAFLKTSAAKNLLLPKSLGCVALLTFISTIFIASGLRRSIASSQEAQLLSPYFPACRSSSTFAPPCRDRELARRFIVGNTKENQSAWCDSNTSSESSCLVPPPRGYRKPVAWPVSLRKVSGSCTSAHTKQARVIHPNLCFQRIDLVALMMHPSSVYMPQEMCQ